MKLVRHVACVVVGLGLAFGVWSVMSAQGSGVASTKPEAIDGVISDKEAGMATEALLSEPSVARLVNDYAGKLTDWQPVEIEGDDSGAYAEITFPVSTFIERPPVIRAANRQMSEGTQVTAGDGSTFSAKDYRLESSELAGIEVEIYMVFVDVETMRVVYLAPKAAPPVVSPAPGEYRPNIQPNHAASADYLGGE